LDQSNIDIKKIDSLIRLRKIDEVLDIIDKELLINQLKFTESVVEMFRGIWHKLADRRNGRRKY
jgi:adenine-specific DNA-methyltransferase